MDEKGHTRATGGAREEAFRRTVPKGGPESTPQIPGSAKESQTAGSGRDGGRIATTAPWTTAFSSATGAFGTEPNSHGQAAVTFESSWASAWRMALGWQQASGFAASMPQAIALSRQHGISQAVFVTAAIGAGSGAAQAIPFAWAGQKAMPITSERTNLTKRAVAPRTVLF